MFRKLKIAYYCSNRTVFPPPKNLIAANATVMQDIAEEMIKRGHEVTIYASKGSKLSGAKIIDLGLDAHNTDIAYDKSDWVTDLNDAYRISYISQIAQDSKNYDLIHLHVGRPIFGEPFIKFCHCPVLFTVHEEFNPAFGPLMRYFQKANLISISDSQRKPIPDLNYISTIYHGVDPHKIPYYKKTNKNKFVFLSRLVESKGIETAIAAAQKTKICLNIYGPCEKNYFKNFIKPALNKKIKYRGLAEKFSEKWNVAYGSAMAILFPIQWEEPFGLTMIESMATGTPVIAFAKGSSPEIIKDGITGFIVNYSNKDKRGNWVIKQTGLNGITQAIQKINSMNDDEYLKMRENCRKEIEKNFSIKKMADDYEKIYYKIIKDFKK